MKTTVRKIGALEAKTALEQMKINRKLNKNKVLAYAKDMKEGKWIAESGESIKFDKSGSLIDGQHRLNAIIQADAEIQLTIVTDVDDDAQKVIDGGNRTLNDMFKIMQVAYHDKVAIIVKGLYNYEYMTGGNKKIKTTNLSHRDYYESNQKFIDDIVADLKDIAYKNNQAKLFPPSLLLVAGAVILKKGGNYEKVMEFLNMMASGKHIPFEGVSDVWHKYEDLKRNDNKIIPKTFNEILYRSWNNIMNKEHEEIKLIGELPEIEV